MRMSGSGQRAMMPRSERVPPPASGRVAAWGLHGMRHDRQLSRITLQRAPCGNTGACGNKQHCNIDCR